MCLRVSTFIADGLKQKGTRVTFKQVAVGKRGLDGVARHGGPQRKAGVDLTSRGQNEDECEFSATCLKTARSVHPRRPIIVSALF